MYSMLLGYHRSSSLHISRFHSNYLKIVDNLHKYQSIVVKHPLDKTVYSFNNDNFRFIDVYVKRDAFAETRCITRDMLSDVDMFQETLYGGDIRVVIRQNEVYAIIDAGAEYYISGITLRNL